MARSLLIVQSNPVPGQEAEFDRWFTEQHLADVVQLDGFAGGVLLRKSAFQRNEQGAAHPFRNLAVYELEGDPAVGVAALDSAGASGRMQLSPTLAQVRLSVVYDQLAEVRRR